MPLKMINPKLMIYLFKKIIMEIIPALSDEEILLMLLDEYERKLDM